MLPRAVGKGEDMYKHVDRIYMWKVVNTDVEARGVDTTMTSWRCVSRELITGSSPF